MNRRLAVAAGTVAILLTRAARAQEVTIGYQGLPYKSSGETNTGIQVSDGVLLHVGVGAEVGYDSNVFYDTSPAAIGSGLVRVLPYAEIANASRTGPASSQLIFDARAGLQYRRYLSDDQTVRQYDNAWLPTAGLSLGIGSGQLGFGLADTFARIEDPPYGPQTGCGGAGGSCPITRYNNQASIEGRWSPGGGRLAVVLRYTNMIDVFEDNGGGSANYSYANSVTNYLMLDAAWKWLPKTAVFANVQQGYISYLNNQNPSKVSSYPLQATVGLRGLLTEKTAAVLSLGYANAFYSSGDSTGGFWGSTYGELAVTVRPTQLSRVVVGYRHAFVNAVISSFAYTETAYASYIQQVAGRLALDLSGRYTYADYQGNFVDINQVGRVDNIFQVGASLDYFLRNWTYLGVAYSLLGNSSNQNDLNYLKQQMFVRLGITY